MANRRCRHCKEYNIPKEAPKFQFVCGVECSIGYARKVVARKRAKEQSVVKTTQKQQSRKFKENDYPKQFRLTKLAAQKLANLLDKSLGCISCGCPRNVQFCGGHFRTVGAHREMALDIRNIHGQCNRYCNLGLSGNVAGNKTSQGYRAGLSERYGRGFVEYLEGNHSERHFKCEELIALRKEYNAEIRRLQSGMMPSRNWREIPVTINQTEEALNASIAVTESAGS
jgi:hypothetical protein